MEEKPKTKLHSPPTVLPPTTAIPNHETFPQYVSPTPIINNNNNRRNFRNNFNNTATSSKNRRASLEIVKIERAPVATSIPISEQPRTIIKRAFFIQIFIDIFTFFFKFIYWVFAYCLLLIGFIFVIIHPHLIFIWIGCMINSEPNKIRSTGILITVGLFQAVGCSGVAIVFGWLSVAVIYRIPFIVHEMI